MSPKDSRRRRSERKHRPQDSSRATVRAARSMIPSDLLAALLAAGKDMVRGDGALEAEQIASSLLSLWWGHKLIGVDVEEVLGEAMVAEAARRRTSQSLVLLTAVASVADGRLRSKAATAAQALDRAGITGPSWLGHVGQATPVGAYRSWDEAGDAYSVVVLFAFGDESPHAVCVLVDRNLGGLAKNAWLTEQGMEVIELYREQCARNPLMRIEEMDMAHARELVEEAFAVTERALHHDPPISADLGGFRALILSRVSLLPRRRLPATLGELDIAGLVALSLLDDAALPEDRAFFGDGDHAELTRFLATSEVTALGRPRIVRAAMEAILEHSTLFDDGRILRVSPSKNEMLLTDWLPKWADLSASEVAVLPELLAVWCRHAATRAGRDPQVLDQALTSIETFGPGLGAAVAEADAEGYGWLCEQVASDDIWGRAEEVDRLRFCLLVDPGPLFDAELVNTDGALHDIAMLAHPGYDGLDLEIESIPLVQGLPSEEDAARVGATLHLMLHDVIATQLWDDDPPQAWHTVRRLQVADLAPHEIHHMLMMALSEPMRRTFVEEEPFDGEVYLDRLTRLPGLLDEPLLP